MALVYANYIFAIALFVFSWYIDIKIGKQKQIAGFCSIAAVMILFAALTGTFAYVGSIKLAGLLGKLFIVLFSYSVFWILKIGFLFPNDRPSVAGKLISFFWILISLFFAFTVIKGITYTSTGLAFDVLPVSFFGISVFFAAVKCCTFFLPLLGAVVLLLRSFSQKSRVYKYQMRLIALSIFVASFVVPEIMGYASAQTIFTGILPLSLISWAFFVFAFFVFKIIQVSVLPGRRLLVGRVVSFFISMAIAGILFAAVALIVDVMTAGKSLLSYTVLQVVILTVSMILFLNVMNVLKKNLTKLLRARTEYQNDLEKELSSIDYAAGSETVMKIISGALQKYVGASSIDIIVETDSGELVPCYTTRERGVKFESDQKLLDFLLSKNIQVMIRSQVRTHVLYAEYRTALLSMFEKLDADAILVHQESHRIIGLFVLGKKSTGSSYTEYDYKAFLNLHSYFFLIVYYLKNIANESVINTIDRELSYSGQVISAIQENIDPITNEKVDVSYLSKSARNLGGDFIDFIKLSPERHLFVMGDVSGKGLNASMSMVILKSVIRTFLQETSDFKDLVCKVNGFIKHNLPKGTFFAGVFGLFDFSENLLYYINCGIPAMLLYTNVYNNAVEIQGDGRVLGFAKDVSKMLKVKKIVLNPNDILMMVTDGIIDSESLRGERFGKPRLQKHLMDNRSYDAERITQFLFENFKEFTSRELSDDVTILTMKYQGNRS